MVERVLVAYDGSPPSNDALEYAFETFPEADMTALHVIEVPESHVAILEGPEIRPPVTERLREHGMDVLDEAMELAAAYGRALETEILTGKPDRRIVDYATQADYDTIVIGSHGREGISRVLLGTVSEDVVRRAPMPVVVVR
ncbi:universal stress protein [Natronorubrum sulfidifaciens]|uniref:UspA domain-containing protein n=1 Tax=Natronorubrum sulfidifaciens JCM 14089 TaxID=1230460 RepID=L9W5P2_9EURY|nr:universal stress protein [Natronorubrum sulfidifaciens]ELY44586.1 UspA domain-containing protein [Natronorubrum sulfidifaciens JCM 14089]